MSSPEPPPSESPPSELPSSGQPPKDHSKLIGRLIIVGFGILLLAYLIPLALNFVD